MSSSDASRDPVAAMTLDDALALLAAEPIACACIGGPTCCLRQHAQAEALAATADRVADVLRQVMNAAGSS